MNERILLALALAGMAYMRKRMRLARLTAAERSTIEAIEAGHTDAEAEGMGATFEDESGNPLNVAGLWVPPSAPPLPEGKVR